MQEQPIIRKARPEDASQISELISRVAHYFAPGSTDPVAAWFASSITPSAIAGRVNDPKFNYLAGFVGQTLAGVIAVRDTTHVHHLFVAPEFQRKGLAGKLWARAKADAVSSGNKDRSREAAI